jgi:voltage-gated potassium channel
VARPRRIPPRLRITRLTAGWAAIVAGTVTLVITVLGGVLMWALDHDEFPHLGTALWWSVQTVTTVGYGDVVPTAAHGRAIAAVVMLTGIAFLTIITATLATLFVESARHQRQRKRRGRTLEEAVEQELRAINARLDGLGAPPASSQARADE